MLVTYAYGVELLSELLKNPWRWFLSGSNPPHSHSLAGVCAGGGGLSQGVCSVAEHVVKCIVARERDGGSVSNFHIFESMPLSDGHVGMALS